MTNGIAGGPVRVGPTLAMRVIVGIPRPLSREQMNHLLEALVRINLDWLIANPDAPSIYDADRIPPTRDAPWPGVRYMPEPTGYELWDPIALLLVRKAGDCDDFACARAAELRFTGEDVDARADCYPSRISQGRRTWHAIVVRGDGTVEDPSARLGMKVRPQHIADGQPFRVIQESHAHLEGAGAADSEGFVSSQPSPSPRHHEEHQHMRHCLKWEVRPRDGGGWQGSIWFGRCETAPLHAVHAVGPTPGDALQHATEAAVHSAHALEAAGLDLGSMIPGLLTTGLDLVRTFTGGGSSPAPQSAPQPWQQFAQTSAMRSPYPPPMPYGYAAPPPPYYPSPYKA